MTTASAQEKLNVLVLRLSVNGAAARYTEYGIMFDISNRRVHARIIETQIPLDDILRSLRAGDRVDLKLWTEVPGRFNRVATNPEVVKVEYEGPATVRMIRYRAAHRGLPTFSVLFDLKA